MSHILNYAPKLRFSGMSSFLPARRISSSEMAGFRNRPFCNSGSEFYH